MLSFASANPAAAAPQDTGAETPGYCPRPGVEIVADSPTARVDSSVEVEAPEPASFESSAALEVPAADAVRVATFDAQLTRDTSGTLFEELSAPGVDDATEAAKLIQTVRPDVLVLTGIDMDAGQSLADAFNTNYLAVGGDTTTGMSYPYSYTGESNAGVDSGADLDRNGTIGDAGDALGYGKFPGQASMLIYSTFPIDTENIRDFTSLPWNAMPQNRIPEEFSNLEQDTLPLSSVSHWDIPVTVDDEALHVLASSVADPTRTNHDAARNHDQIRFWGDYLDPESDYIRDHRGIKGPLHEDASFVIAGSLKADPNGHGPADSAAISDLLANDSVVDPEPTHATADSMMGQGIIPNDPTIGTHTAPTPGNEHDTYRADYVLPSNELAVTGAGVLDGDIESSNSRGFLGFTSDAPHHIVWADIILDK